MWIIDINGEDPITYKGALDELQKHHNQRSKYKVRINLCRSKSHHRSNLEDIWSIFDKVRPVVSHIEVHLPEKPPIPKNIGEALKGPQRKFWKEALFVQYNKKKMSNFFWIPYL